MASATARMRADSQTWLRTQCPDFEAVESARPCLNGAAAAAFDGSDIDTLLSELQPENISLSNQQFLGDGAGLRSTSSMPLVVRGLREGGRAVVPRVDRLHTGAGELAFHLGRAFSAQVEFDLDFSSGGFSGQSEVTAPASLVVLVMRGLRKVIVRSSDGEVAADRAMGPGDVQWISEGSSLTMQPAAELSAVMIGRVLEPNLRALAPMVASQPPSLDMTVETMSGQLLPQWLFALPSRPRSTFGDLWNLTEFEGVIEPRMTGGWLTIDSDEEDTSTTKVGAAGVMLEVPDDEMQMLSAPRLVVEPGSASPRLPRLLVEHGLYSPVRDD